MDQLDAIMVSTLLRFRGSIIGAVVGDCLGALFEGDVDIVMEKLLKHFSDVSAPVKSNEGKQWNHCYTDDSAMTFAVANSLIQQPEVLLNVRSFNAKDLANRFVQEYFQSPHRGYGSNVVNVFERLQEMESKDPYGPAVDQFDGRGSYGNGGAMRISPAALFSCRIPVADVDNLVSAITRITHSHEDGINGAILQCAAIQTALTVSRPTVQLLDKWMDEFLAKLLDRVHRFHNDTLKKKTSDAKFSGTELQSYRHKLQQIRQLLSDSRTDRCVVAAELGNEVSALKSVPAAIFSFLRCVRPVEGIPDEYNEFQRTIIYAVSLGGDTDTIASMAGAIAGACYGVEEIPFAWRKACEGTEAADCLAKDIHRIVYADNYDDSVSSQRL